ncbi:hypothetical protein HIM_09498 [Hirsutella minnesotensis 3608]|uniref:Rhodopsin domain-containing protein n=1 Tax=Hirsutella minnesotensis 3608 TaxID=1043627 RepID=A0A0F8A336_9HYPO|nr:hypothetical protein HIM_09498 [Hirsutella minnesotensis 3608]
MGDTPNSPHGHDDGRRGTVFGVTTATLVFATMLFSARLYCRYFIVRNVTWDDKIMMLAWLFAFALSVTINIGVFHGIGNYDVGISESDWDILHRCEYVFAILYVS